MGHFRMRISIEVILIAVKAAYSWDMYKDEIERYDKEFASSNLQLNLKVLM